MPDINALHSLASRANAAEADNARAALENALSALASGQFLYTSGADREMVQQTASVMPTFAHGRLPQDPIDVPLGKTAHMASHKGLPIVAFLVDTRDTQALAAAFTTFLVENNTKPFCRPLFLVTDYHLLPFLGHIGCAYAPFAAPLTDLAKGYLAQKYGVSSFVDFISGQLLT